MSRLDRAVNVATILTCVAVVAVLLRGNLAPQPAQQSGGARTLAAGDEFPDLPGLDFHASSRTLVMVLRQGCQYCAQSLPFYRALAAELERMGPTPVRMVLVTTDDSTTASQYVAANQLMVSAVVSISPERRGELHIAGTPTLAIIDQSRHVQNVWLGRLDANGEGEVRAVVFRHSS